MARGDVRHADNVPGIVGNTAFFAGKQGESSRSFCNSSSNGGEAPMAKFLSRRSYRVGKSRTGLGLFATVLIAKGTRIIRYWGPKLSSKEADERDNKYMFEINSRWTIDGSIRRNTARYVNHACRPNAESDIIGHLILIRSIKNIAPGEEITYDYGKNYFDTYIKPHGCKCLSCIAKRKKERAEARDVARRARERAARKAAKEKVAAGAPGKVKPNKVKSTKAKPNKAKVNKANKAKSAKSKSAKNKPAKGRNAKPVTKLARHSAAVSNRGTRSRRSNTKAARNMSRAA